MDDDAALEAIIDQTIDAAVSTIPEQLEQIAQNKDALHVGDPKEFVYGLIMGMALGMGSAVLTGQKKSPSVEDQLKVRDMIYGKIPQIRGRIFK